MLNAASEKKLVGVRPELQKVARRAAELTKQPFVIVQGARTQAEQNAIYAQGRTKPGKIVTWTRNSKHIGGNAIDFAAWVNGKISWNDIYYPTIAAAFKKAAHELGIGIEWGGDWKTKDWGHVQLSGKAPVSNVVPLKEPAVYDPKRAVSFFMKRGWGKYAACALTAGLMWESGGNGKWTILWDAKGDKNKKGEYTAFYSAQWNTSRLNAFEKFAKENKRAVTDPYIQLAYVDHELQTSEKRAAGGLKSAETIEDANKAAIKFWRPSIPHADKRLAIARKLLASL